MQTQRNDQGALEFILSEARQQAYGLYQAQRWREVEVLVQGILTVDPGDAWTLSLYSSTMRRQRRYREARELIERAHALAPEDTTITALRQELIAFGERAGAALAVQLQ
jgi:predicted Zn-dependent protease